MPLIVLAYQEATTVDGAALVAPAWIRVPLNLKRRDDNGNCVLNVDNTFTISNRVYPKILKLTLFTSFVNSSVNFATVKSRIVKLISAAAFEVLDSSLNARVAGVIVGQEFQGNIKQVTTIQLNKETTFGIDVWTNRNGVFGRASTDGSPERYASVEIKIE